MSQKKIWGPLPQDDKMFCACFKGYGRQKNFPILVQDSLPTELIVSKVLSLLKNFFSQNQLPLLCTQ
jgi:hypothetical protein